MEFCRKLNSPQLVADFQKFFGVEHVKKEYSSMNGAVGDNKSKMNGTVNYGSKGSNYNLRSRSGSVSDKDRSIKRTGYTKLIEKLHDDDCLSTNDNISESFIEPGLETDMTEQSSSASDSGSGSSDEVAEPNDYVVKNKFYWYLFQFGASLGNEVFYIAFFPYWFWNVDGYIGRRVCMFWCIFMYIGQVIKDLIKWPRPTSPPVVRMEKRYALEYGMPSTHAMTGAGVPFAIMYFSKDRYDFPVVAGLIICVLWTAVVCLSRLYLGMHSVADVVVGLIFISILMPIFLPLLDLIDEFSLTHPYAPLICVSVLLVLAVLYPTVEKWSTCRGDSILILGVEAGVMVGHWVAFQTGFMRKAVTPPPYHIIYPTWYWFGKMMMRYALGVVVLVGIRAVMKLATLNTVCYIFGLNKKDATVHQRLIVELPLKFITYAAIAFNVVYTSPYLFRFLGVERETYFTEI